MSQYFRIDLNRPKTRTLLFNAFTWTADSNIVQSCDVELRKEGKSISTATVTLWDPPRVKQLLPLFNELPDPAFAEVPLQIYLAKSGENQTSAKRVFDGKMTSLQAGFPAASHLTIVAHDYSIDMRRRARYQTFRNKTSVQLAQEIAKAYDMTVDTTELGNIVLTQRVIDMGMGGVGRGIFPDWNQVARALAIDGLELYTHGKAIHVRKAAQKVYPTLNASDANVIAFNVTINHVSGPGAGGQFKLPEPGGHKGTQDSSAVAGNKATADAEKADATTHRRPPQGPDAKNNGVAHTESTGTRDGQREASRKDEAELTLWAAPDITLAHAVNLSGWGGKADGLWIIQGINHAIAGSGPTQTTLHLSRPPSDAAKRGAGLPAAPGGTATVEAQAAGSTKR